MSLQEFIAYYSLQDYDRDEVILKYEEYIDYVLSQMED